MADSEEVWEKMAELFGQLPEEFQHEKYPHRDKGTGDMMELTWEELIEAQRKEHEEGKKLGYLYNFLDWTPNPGLTGSISPLEKRMELFRILMEIQGLSRAEVDQITSKGTPLYGMLVMLATKMDNVEVTKMLTEYVDPYDFTEVTIEDLKKRPKLIKPDVFEQLWQILKAREEKAIADHEDSITWKARTEGR